MAVLRRLLAFEQTHERKRTAATSHRWYIRHTAKLFPLHVLGTSKRQCGKSLFLTLINPRLHLSRLTGSHFKVIPFESRNATTTFERMIDAVLCGLKWLNCLCSLDDVVIFSPMFRDHLLRIGEVQSCLPDNGLQLNSNKCTLGTRKHKVLGISSVPMEYSSTLTNSVRFQITHLLQPWKQSEALLASAHTCASSLLSFLIFLNLLPNSL